MTDKSFDETCLNPEDHYSNLSEVVEDPQWSKDQKKKILAAWKANAGDVVRACDEGMDNTGTESEASAQLRNVVRAIERLENA